ncbi:hypothetical protein LCGC14_0336310 [marine sediment metagenome]|uniref:Uncharacterized protein n=1 Tax=marine sediment metagenome TaxID=412755 RepID=A0A0F9W299_9ZZZZ
MGGPAINASKPRQRESKPIASAPSENELRDKIASQLFVTLFGSGRNRKATHIAELSIKAANDFITVLHR